MTSLDDAMWELGSARYCLGKAKLKILELNEVLKNGKKIANTATGS